TGRAAGIATTGPRSAQRIAIVARDPTAVVVTPSDRLKLWASAVSDPWVGQDVHRRAKRVALGSRG
ncbi:MAG: hypothetical protein P8J30_01740, partial [Ilumatobacter sp.]|nr:hypothetical protein [Ilumatobacter sp.]